MTTKVLTTRAIETAKPKAKRYEIPDAACPGLYLVVQPTGTKSWVHRYRRPNGKTAKRTLPAGLSLAAARADVAMVRHGLDRGHDPAPRRLGVAAYNPDSGDAIELVFAAFFEQHIVRKTGRSNRVGAEGIFNNYILPAWKGRAVQSITRRDVIALLERIAITAPYQANRARAILSKFYKWMMLRDIVSASPVFGTEPPHREIPRERILHDDELRALILACRSEAVLLPRKFDLAVAAITAAPEKPTAVIAYETGVSPETINEARRHISAGTIPTFPPQYSGLGAYGDMFMLLVLTAQRRIEVAHMSWDELDGDVFWKLPRSRVKNSNGHIVPLSRQASALIEARPRFVDCPYVFSNYGKGPINDFTWIKHKLSTAAGIAATSWRLHDVRRTAATGLQRLGVRYEIIERILNHILPGVGGIYQRYEFLPEMRVALQKWADHVDALVSGKSTKVVKLRG